MHGEPVGLVERPITLEFDEIEGTLVTPVAYGFAGCNTYQTAYILLSDTGELTISEPVTTRKGCHDFVMQTETSYIAALIQVSSYSVDDESSHQRLNLYTDVGSADTHEQILEFVSTVELVETALFPEDVAMVFLPIVVGN
jgi:hypothetical protein